jgi:hypothetical protein
MNTALEYSTRVVQEGGRRCKKSTLNDLVHLTPLRIPLMNPLYGCLEIFLKKKITLLTVTVLFLFTFFNLILDAPRRSPEFIWALFHVMCTVVLIG